MLSWPYLAGFLDGDGWVTSSKHKNARTRRYTIGFTQKADKIDFMMAIRDFLVAEGVSVGIVQRLVSSPRVLMPVAMVDLRIGDQKSVAMLSAYLLPYAELKRNILNECHAYVVSRIAKRGVLVAPGFQPTNVYWTPLEVDTLLRFHAEEYGNKAIADLMGRSEDSVSHKLYRLGVLRTYRQSPT